MSVISVLLSDGVPGAIIKTTVVLAAAGVLSIAAYRASSAVRHVIWLVAFGGTLAVTVLSLGGPSIPIRLRARFAPEVVAARAVGRFVDDAPGPRFVSRRDLAWRARSAVARPPRRWGSIARDRAHSLAGAPLAAVIWLVGLLIVAGRTVAGHLVVARLIARSRPVDSTDWTLALMRAARDVRFDGSVALLASDDVQSPITSGFTRPVVIVPADASTWDDERRHVVLVHELAHVARGDYASQLVATITCAIYWFNPLVWLAAARLRIEAEHAADDLVLTTGTSGVAYATHLLELARHERSLHLAAAVAVGMIRSTRLEGRFRAMLDTSRPRAAVSPALQLTAILIALAIFVPLGGLRVDANAMPVHRASTARAVFGARSAMPARSAAVAARAFQPGRGADSTFEKTIDAASGDRLRLDLKTGGSIVLHGWNEPRVRLRARLAGRNWRDTRVRLERVGREVRLLSDFDGTTENTSTSHAFELWVPRSIDVDVASSGGAVTIDHLDGELSGYSGGGEITITSSSGRATLTTGGGDIHVSNSSLSGTVSTGGGAVEISNVTGGLSGTSGSGPVITSLSSGTTIRGVGEGVGGTVRGTTVSPGVDRGVARAVSGTITSINTRGGSVTTTTYPEGRALGTTSTRGFLPGATSISKAGGSVSLSEMPSGGVVHTGGGAISIGSSSGLIDVSTGGGDVELRNMSGDAVVSTGAGDVEITVVNKDGREHSVSVYSGKGPVILELPADLDARLELETAYTDNYGERTKIRSDFRLTESETADWDDHFGTPRKFVRGTATLGSGRGLIRVRTVNGDIVVRRR